MGGEALYQCACPRGLSGPGRRFRFSSSSAFSLIEIIAALAIIAILTAATLPSLIKQIDYANQAMEGTNLLALATGLTQGGCSQRYIPGQADWATFIAANIGWQVGSVQTNARNNTRVFLIDPTLGIGTNTANTLPYQQNNFGASGITNARFIIISSQPGPLPFNLTSGVPSASDFNALWNNPIDTVPQGTSWSFNPNGQGADIKIQRINFASSFSHVVLTCLDLTNAAYSIDGYSTNTVPLLGGKFDAYLLNGTVLNLYYWSTNTATLQAAQIIQQDASWFFCNGLWRNAPCPSDLLSPGSLEVVVQSFFGLNLNTPLVYADMTNYMGLYLQWEAVDFKKNDPLRALLQTATIQLKGDINNLVTTPP